MTQNSFSSFAKKSLALLVPISLLASASLMLVGCAQDGPDEAIYESAQKQREQMGNRGTNNPALQPGQPGAPPAGSNPAGTTPPPTGR